MVSECLLRGGKGGWGDEMEGMGERGGGVQMRPLINVDEGARGSNGFQVSSITIKNGLFKQVVLYAAQIRI